MFSLAAVMRVVRIVFGQFRKVAIAFPILILAGCTYVTPYTAPLTGNPTEGPGTAEGEQHDFPFAANDTFMLTQDVLRQEGILFEVKTETSLVTLWKDADVGPGVLGSLVGKHPEYRYEIEIVPQSSNSSRMVVNVRTEDIAEADIPKYEAGPRLNLFGKIDELAAKFPPSGGTPKEGGVNYALLPNEDLKGLAKRATGNADNWRQIAEDNGLKSPTDGANLPSIWIRNTLLSAPGKGAEGNN